jgi:hypothetical protein
MTRMLRNTCEFVTGRLLEIRVAAGYRSVADVDDMIGMIMSNTAKLSPEEKYAIVADWRNVHVMAPDTAAAARKMLTTVNPRVTRSAILTAPANPTTNLQTVRLIREAENPNRRHFTSTTQLHAWLAEVLTSEEAARLETFLASSS